MRNDGVDGDARMAGLLAFNQLRKQGSREKLLGAAIKLFCKHGYGAVSIEDITAEAGVSRITYYRHFPTKSAVALELFQRSTAEGAPRVLAIGRLDYRDRPTVVEWLADFFAADRDMQGILHVLAQANVEEADFTGKAQPFIAELISKLGTMIPAFAFSGSNLASNLALAEDNRWVKAWLLIYTILDQSNHAATRSGIANNPMMIEVLADGFIDFVSSHEAGGAAA